MCAIQFFFFCILRVKTHLKVLSFKGYVDSCFRSSEILIISNMHSNRLFNDEILLNIIDQQPV